MPCICGYSLLPNLLVSNTNDGDNLFRIYYSNKIITTDSTVCVPLRQTSVHHNLGISGIGRDLPNAWVPRHVRTFCAAFR